jgi:cyclophilin family peptidyl-prolyl cis-trans isomerase
VASAWRHWPDACGDLVAAAADSNPQVAITALDRLARCGSVGVAVSVLEAAAGLSDAAAGLREWSRRTHAIVALASASPDRAAELIDDASRSAVWQVRRAAAVAATRSGKQAIVEALAVDADERVAKAAGKQPATESAANAAPFVPAVEEIDAATIQRLAAPRARVTIRGVGTIEVALLTSEAPVTVLWFAAAAESGALNGVSIGRVIPGMAAVAHSAPPPAASSHELGSWPHVRGAVGLIPSISGRAPAIVVHLGDSPALDRRYPVFAQVLNGMDLLDELVDGDVIERVEIIPRS